MVLSSRVPRAVTTPAGTCMGARGRDFLLGIRRGQPAGAQIHVWCSWHECTDGRSRRAGSPGQFTLVLIVPFRDTGRTPEPLARASLELLNEVGASDPEHVGHRLHREPAGGSNN